jgi:hypothetical protein
MMILSERLLDSRFCISTGMRTASGRHDGNAWLSYCDQTSPLDSRTTEHTIGLPSCPGDATAPTEGYDSGAGQRNAPKVLVSAEKNKPARMRNGATDAVARREGLV